MEYFGPYLSLVYLVSFRVIVSCKINFTTFTSLFFCSEQGLKILTILLFIDLHIIYSRNYFHFSSIINCYVFQCSEQWLKILTQLAACDLYELQHRGVFIIYNLMSASKDIAGQIVASQLFEVLMALSKLDDPKKADIKEIVENSLDKAVEWELIKPINNS